MVILTDRSKDPATSHIIYIFLELRKGMKTLKLYEVEVKPPFWLQSIEAEPGNANSVVSQVKFYITPFFFLLP